MELKWTEEPLAWVTLCPPVRLNKTCGFCLRNFPKLHRCLRCRAAQYCSKECQVSLSFHSLQQNNWPEKCIIIDWDYKSNTKRLNWRNLFYCQAADWSLGPHKRECSFVSRLSTEASLDAFNFRPRLRLVGRLLAHAHPDKAPDKAAEEVDLGLGGLRNAQKEWGKGGTLCEDDGKAYESRAEKDWEMFRQLYIRNSAFFKRVVTKDAFMEALGIAAASGLPVANYDYPQSLETGIAIYPKTAALAHSCLPDSHYVAHGRSLRLFSAAAVPSSLSRVSSIQAPEQMSAEKRQSHLRKVFSIRCACGLCAAAEPDTQVMRMARDATVLLLAQISDIMYQGEDEDATDDEIAARNRLLKVNSHFAITIILSSSCQK